MSQTGISLVEAKSAVRQAALERRAALDPVQRVEGSLAIAEFVDDLKLPAGAVVAGFLPIREEIDPRPLLDVLRARGHQLCLPIVAKPHLIFRSFDRDTVFVPAGFGTVAPGPDAPEVQPDVLLMPLAAFDKSGNRAGYGKGHYDTAILALQKQGPLTCIGLAFEAQQAVHVPTEPHDQRLDGILTETGYRAFSPNNS